MSETLHIDWTRCQGRGLCVELLAATLQRDEWGYPLAAGVQGRERTDIPIRPEDRHAAAEAVRLCPLAALSLQR